MSAVNLSHSDSEGETIQLFGRDFVVSTATDTDTLVLFSSAQEVNLNLGGSAPNPTANVVIGGTNYTVELVTGTSTTATIAVNGESKEVTEGNSKKIGGIDIAVKSVTESTAIDTITASILVGSNKLTFENGATVTSGSDNDPIDGTYAYLVGTPIALTKLAVTVFRAETSNDAILEGASFVDPVFGSFKVDFKGLNIPINSTSRETLTIKNSGDDTISLTMTDSGGSAGTFDVAHNATYGTALAGQPVRKPANWRLADDGNFSIFTHEGANLTEDDFIVLGNEDYGHIVQVTQLYNNTGTDYTQDKVRVRDAITGDNYDATFTAETIGTISVDGKTYAVKLEGSGDDAYVSLKYPTSDSATTLTWIIYPTIESAQGAKVSLYEPLDINMSAFNGTASTSAILKFPDGDGYTSATFTYSGGNGSLANWTVAGAGTTNLTTGTGDIYSQTTSNITIGELTYSFFQGATVNRTTLYVIDPEGTAVIDNPGLVIFEGKDDNNAYDAIVVDFEGNAASMGSSTNGVGVNDVLFSTNYGHYAASLATDSDITQDVDWFGVITTTNADDSDQKFLTISYPASQIYAQIFLGEIAATVSGGTTSGGATELGSVTVSDAEISTVQAKNLVVVGGSCINAVAAKVLGSETPICSAAFTTATTVADGQYLIQVLASPYTTGKVAMLVAGYNAADTTKAATYLVNNAVNTSVGTKLKGTTVTDATVVTA